MQTSLPPALPLAHISAKLLNVYDVEQPLDSAACISIGQEAELSERSSSMQPPLQRLSWTEEFLRAMGALQTAQEDMPEFPAEQNVPLADLPSWAQELWPIWRQSARPGPGAVEYIARVETWYTDHSRVQHCLSSRIVVLGSDPSSWVNDILAAWRDLVLPAFDIQIVAVLPMTDDQAPNICAQLLLIQRPDRFSRSIIVTVSDTAVQRGLPQSCAIVAGDHVRLHSVLLMTGLLYHCPPEVLTNRCRLYYGTRELRGEAYIPAVHGDVFNLVIQRDVTVDIHTLIGLPDPHLRQRLAALLEQGIHYLHVQDGERPDLPAVLAPDWFSQLEQVFDAHAAPELLEEGPVFYVHTWFLDALTTTRCPVSRPVRLLQDRRTWRSLLIGAWQDQIHTHQSIDFAVVDPEPPRMPWMSPTAHILLTQRADPVHASVLISAVLHQEAEPSLLQAMYYLPQRVSGADIIEAHLDQRLRGPCCVRRGQHIFPAIQAVQIENGDSLEIDVHPAATVQEPAETDATNLLQRQATFRKSTMHTVTLSLDAVIPPNQDADLSKLHPPELLFSEEDDWSQRLYDMDLRFGPLPEALDLRATTLHALQDPAMYLEASFAGQLALYVDGSARGHTAAWSVIAVEYDWQGTPTLLGVLSDRVELNCSSKQWIGATHADNVSAEITASIAAHLAAIAIGHTAITVIRPDLKLSAMLSTSTWMCHSHRDLVALARWLGAWFAQGGGACQEVRGHSAHPWNDLADSLARHALNTTMSVGCIDFTFCHQVLTSGDLAWAWLGLQPHCYTQCLPPNGVPTSWLAQPSVRKVDPLPEQHDLCEGQWHQAQFTIASANVLAISPDLPALPAETASSRADRLEHQWHHQQIAVIGLQESRRAAGRYATTHYHVFASGALHNGGAPHGGCEIWLHKQLPFLRATESSISFAQLRPAISCADPRRLVLHLHGPQFSCSFVVLHAPCRSQHTSIEEIETWWAHTTDLLAKAELAPMTWLFVDANAPLETSACDNFGDHGSEPSNDQGRLFEQFILAGQWFAPTTMSWCHGGPHSTWTHPRGHRLRRDYVLCSEQALRWCTASWTDQAHDGGFAHEDHVPVCLQHSGWWYIEPSSAKPQWDRCAFLDPVRCHEFQQALATLPMPSWTVHINDHADHFQHSVMQLARQFFTKKSGERVRPRLSEPTLALIQLKRSFLDYARAQSCIQRDDIKTELRCLERMVRARVQEDHRQFYDQLVQQLAHDGTLHDFRSVYQLLSRLGGGHVTKQAKADRSHC